MINQFTKAADNYNLEAGDRSWFETAIDGTLATAGSAVVGAMNSVGSIYNMVTGSVPSDGGYEQVTTDEALRNAGMSDSAGFYAAHPEGTDLAGLIAGSLIPGSLGIKAIKTVANSSKIMTSLGLSSDALTALRAEALSTGQVAGQIFNPLHGQTIKAMASGLGNQVLEMAAFEAASLSLTFKSPVYDQMSAKDMVFNSLTNVAVGGAIGGAFSAAKTYMQVGRGIEAAALDRTIVDIGHEGLPAANNIILGKATGASAVKLTDEVVRFSGGDSGISSKLNELVKNGSVDSVAQTLGFATESSRLGNLKTILTDFTDEAGVTIKLPEYAPHQVVDLKTGEMFADSSVIKAKNIGDTIPDGAWFDFRPMQDLAIIRDANGKELKTFDVATNLKDATVEEAQARWIATAQMKKLPADIDILDIPAMARMLATRDFASTIGGVPSDFKTVTESLGRAKQYTLDYLQNTRGLTDVEIAKILNISEDLKIANSGFKVPMDAAVLEKEFMSPQYAAIYYDTDAFAAAYGNAPPLYTAEAIRYAQNIAKLDSLSREKTSARALAQVSSAAGESSLSMVDEQTVLSQLPTASNVSKSSGAISSASGAYGTIQSWAENTGRLLNRMATTLKTKNLTTLSPSLLAITKDPKLADELILVTNRLRLTDARYVFVEGESGAVRYDVAMRNRAEAGNFKKVPELDASIDSMKNPEMLPMSAEVEKFLRTHAAVNIESYRKPASMLASAHGMRDVKIAEDIAEFIPVHVPPINTEKYAHFVLVRQDPKVFGEGGHVSAIVANSAEQLQKKVTLAKQQLDASGEDSSKYLFLTKSDTKAYYEAQGNYQYARGMNESRVDSSLRKAGVLGEENPLLSYQTKDKSTQAIVDDYVNFHGRMSGRILRDITESKYAEVYSQLRATGETLTELEASKMANVTQAALASTKNPYMGIIKTSLDISNFNEFDKFGWVTANRVAETLGTAAINGIKDASNSFLEALGAKGVGKMSSSEIDGHLLNINKTASDLGMPGIYEKASYAQYADAIAGNPQLSHFISRGNGLISMFALGLDVIQHLNNAVGAAVMQSAEMGSLISAIRSQDARVAGKLVDVKIPDLGLGAGDTGISGTIMGTTKLNANAVKRFWQGGKVWNVNANDGKGAWEQWTSKQLMEDYKREGLTITELQQYKSIIDNLSITGGEGIADLNGRILKSVESFGEKGRQLTGGNFSERFTRFIAADAMRQITDEALAMGILGEAEAKTYWNTAVNRIQGNMVASQRPVMFQGAIGQAIGLFMTYQVNMMQQLFRYAGNGDKVGTSMLLGTQGALYGMQGMPGWNFLNTHIIGNADGNLSHADMYSTVNKVADKELADWVLYGAGSNMFGLIDPSLKFNLYTRGDINPRTATVVPTAIKDTVLYNATIKFIGDIVDTASSISNGAPIGQALLQGLQHQGLNRPLAGLGAVVAGGQYTADGKLIASTEPGLALTHLSDWVRLAGAKPLDDALAADALFRMRAYDAHDKVNREKLAVAVRLEAADGTINPDSLLKFSELYAKSGGNPSNFRGFIAGKLKDQNETIIEQSVSKLISPEGRNIQAIIGANQPNFNYHRRAGYSDTGVE